MEEPKIFDFLSYREFLKHYYEWRKEKHQYFSFRFLGNKLGLDPSLLSKIILEKRHLSDNLISTFCEYLEFNKQEQEYFENLVYFNKAKSDSKARLYLEKLMKFRKNTSNRLIMDKMKFYSKWYYTAVRSILEFYEFSGNYKELSRKLNPCISEEEARDSIELLESLNLIQCSEEGVYQLTDHAITTGDEWKSVAVHSFQQETIQLAKESLDRHPRQYRDISTISMNINDKDFEFIKERIKEFRESIIDYVSQQDGPDRTYHLNLQLLPLTLIEESIAS